MMPPEDFPIVIAVRGVPKPGGSKRGFLHKSTGRVILTDASGKAGADWRGDCKAAAGAVMRDRPPLDGELHVGFEFTFPRPKAHYTKRGLRPDAPQFVAKKPDTTKLVRSIEDALTGIVWRDDALIVRQSASKVYGDTPGCVVTVRPCTDP